MELLFSTVREALSERYDVRQVVGTGGMATVFEAWDRAEGRTVAIKVLKPKLASGVPLERFRREVRVASKLAHPHIVPIVTHGELDELPYFVMPFIDGDTVRQRLQRDRVIPLPESIQIARQIAAALTYAHQHGIMHRDIKPENIILSEHGAVVADFGIARGIEDEGVGLTLSGTTVGTPDYMSPEQATGAPVDGRTDIYSLGCVLYEMIAGKRPFSHLPSPFARKPEERPAGVSQDSDQTVPTEVDTLISTCLEWSPDKRFATATDLENTLHHAQMITGIPTPAESVTGQARGWAVLGIVAAAILSAAFLISRLVGPFAQLPTVQVNVFRYLGPSQYAETVRSLERGVSDALASRVGLLVYAPDDSEHRPDFVLNGTLVVDTTGTEPIGVVIPVLLQPGRENGFWTANPDTVLLSLADIEVYGAAVAGRVAEAILGRSPEDP